MDLEQHALHVTTQQPHDFIVGDHIIIPSDHVSRWWQWMYFLRHWKHYPSRTYLGGDVRDELQRLHDRVTNVKRFTPARLRAYATAVDWRPCPLSVPFPTKERKKSK